MKIFIAGMPHDMDDAELEEFFEKFGTVTSAKVAMDKATGKSRGFGFVEMLSREEGLEAIEGLNGLPIGRKSLVVKEAENKPSAPTQERTFNNPPRTGGNFAPRRNFSEGGYNRNNSGNRNKFSR